MQLVRNMDCVHLASQGPEPGLAESFIHGHILRLVTIRAKMGKKEPPRDFPAAASRFDAMIADMAEARKALVWTQTRFFMGWACGRCGWRHFIPRAAPTALAPSEETLLAFKEHRCRQRSSASGSRPNSLQPSV
jgi:hypothetical protein